MHTDQKQTPINYFIQSNLDKLSTLFIGVNAQGLMIESNSPWVQKKIQQGYQWLSFVEEVTLSYEFARVESFLKDQYNNQEVFWTEMKACFSQDEQHEDYLIIGNPIVKDKRFEGYIIECVKLNPIHIKLSKYQTLDPISDLFDRSFGERVGQILFNKNLQGNKPFTLVGFEIVGFSHFEERYSRETVHHVLHFTGQSIKRCLRQNDTPYDADQGRFYVLCEASKEDLRPMIERVQAYFKGALIKEIDGVVFLKSAYADLTEVHTFQQMLHLIDMRLKA